MMWSVALFGYNKHRFELRENELSLVRLSMGINYEGIELFKDVWIHKTVGRFIERPTEFDENLYFVYEVTGWEKRTQPGDIIELKTMDKANTWTPQERKSFLIITLDNINEDQIIGIKEPVWDMESFPSEEIPHDGHIELYPFDYIRKRRFSIPLNTLENAGVNLTTMMDKETLYSPIIRGFDKLECFDNLNSRNVLETDNLRPINPRLD